MTNVKDKLSASVRQAKAAQKPEAEAPAAPEAAKPEARPAPAAARKTPTARARPAAAKATVSRKATTPVPERAAAAGKTSGPAEIPESGSALFPERVWPD